jgi:NAD(P)-dependent dehydrogenase (short-subunit alcohol dehydrogenase family)
VAKALAGKGAALFLVAREEEALKQGTEELRAEGAHAEFYPCDLTEPAPLYDLIDIALSRFKKLDILVNIGGEDFRAPLLGTERPAVEAALDSSLRGPISMTQAALPALLKSAPSEIVNIATILGRHAAAEFTISCAASFGLVGFSRALALELEPAGIRVTTVCPGPLASDAPGEGGLSPEQVARAVVSALETPHAIAHEEIAFHQRAPITR